MYPLQRIMRQNPSKHLVRNVSFQAGSPLSGMISFSHLTTRFTGGYLD